MKELGYGFYWQDLEVGSKFKTFGRTITETDVVTYCNAVGLIEPLFTDMEWAAKNSAVKGRLVPAALIYSIAEGLALAGTGHATGLAFLNTEIDVRGPTLVGDTVHVTIEVTEQRATSKGRGLVRTRNEVINQKGDVIMVYTPLRMMAGRPE